MHYLRSILFDAAVVILTLVVSLSAPFMALFNASSATVRAVSQVWANGIMFLMKYVVGLDYRIEGREHVPDGPCIIACNHQSLWETAALCVIFPDASIVAKEELRKLPLVGWFLERYPMILVDRSAGRQALRQMVDEAKRAVGDAPGDAAAPIVAREMKARLAVARGGCDRRGVVHQAVDQIV